MAQVEGRIQIPAQYESLTPAERRAVRVQYIADQGGNCMFCGESLSALAPERIRSKKINWRLFPPNFLKHPIHLQHNHKTGMTEGAVHSYCNAVMWQYYGR